MYTILVNDPRGTAQIGFPEFQERFVEICRSYRETDGALAFAFILYDLTNPEVSKMLADRDYWRALDLISGNRLAVFSFHFSRPRPRPRPRGPERDLVQWLTTVDSPSLDGPHSFIKKTFGVNVQEAGPAVLFFQVADDKILDSVLASIDADKVEDVFVTVKTLLVAVVGSIADVLPENRKNAREIWNLITSELSNQQFWKIAKWVGEKVSLETLLSALTGR